MWIVGCSCMLSIRFSWKWSNGLWSMTLRSCGLFHSDLLQIKIVLPTQYSQNAVTSRGLHNATVYNTRCGELDWRQAECNFTLKDIISSACQVGMSGVNTRPSWCPWCRLQRPCAFKGLFNQYCLSCRHRSSVWWFPIESHLSFSF